MNFDSFLTKRFHCKEIPPSKISQGNTVLQTSKFTHQKRSLSKFAPSSLHVLKRDTNSALPWTTFRLIVLNVHEMPLTMIDFQAAQFKPNARPVQEEITMKCLKQTQTHCAISTLPQLAAACRAVQPSLSRMSIRAP